MSDDLLSTGQAAKAIGVYRTTLGDWWRDGLVEPASVTAGGHGRWRLSDLEQQVRELLAAKAKAKEAAKDAAHARPEADPPTTGQATD